MRPIINVDRQWLHDGMYAQCGSMQGKVGNTYEAGKLNLIRYLTYSRLLSFSCHWLMSHAYIMCMYLLVV